MAVIIDYDGTACCSICFAVGVGHYSVEPSGRGSHIESGGKEDIQAVVSKFVEGVEIEYSEGFGMVLDSSVVDIGMCIVDLGRYIGGKVLFGSVQPDKGS